MQRGVGARKAGLELHDRLTSAEYAGVIAVARRQSFEKGEIIVAQEDGDRDVFVLLSGRARVRLFSSDGKAVDYRDIVEGAIFGELSAIDGAPRSANVVAVDQVEVGRITHAAFRTLLQDEPGLAWALLEHLSAQIRVLTSRIFEYSTMAMQRRLVAELLRLADAAIAAEPEARAIVIRNAPTHFDLASRISSHREAVSREMSELRKVGILARRGRHLLILDLARLRSMSNPQL